MDQAAKERLAELTKEMKGLKWKMTKEFIKTIAKAYLWTALTLIFLAPLVWLAKYLYTLL